jgi:hypothetical protein
MDMEGWYRHEKTREFACLINNVPYPVTTPKMRIHSGDQKLCFWAQAELAHSKPEQWLFHFKMKFLGICHDRYLHFT